MTCRYSEICPAYDKRRYRCEHSALNDIFDPRSEYGKCVPLLLEAYHQEKGTPYKEISKYLI